MPPPAAAQDFPPAAAEGRGRVFPGYGGLQTRHLPPGEALWLELRGGDILSVAAAGALRVAVFNPAGGGDEIRALLGAAAPPPANQPPRQHYDSRMLNARLRGLNLPASTPVFYPFDGPTESPVVWRCDKAAVFVAVCPEQPEAMVAGNSDGGAEITLQREAGGAPLLPVPLAEVADEFTIPRATAKSYRLPKGAYVQIIDIEGRQCSDFMAFNAQALDNGAEKHIDGTVTRTFARGAYPGPGLFDKFYDSDINPLLSVVQDTIGRHDTFALACTARGYEERGFPGHINCSDNISAAMSPFGVQARRAWPAVNFFFNTWIVPQDGALQSDEAWSRPGDYVLLRALTDLVCVSTACPDDIDPINGWNPTDIHIRIYSPAGRVKPARARRIHPNEPAIMTTESPFHNKTSQLTKHYDGQADYWTPRHFDALGAIGEYWACREKATMQDMSNLRICDIAGVDALAFLQKVLTRDIRRVALNKGVYALLCGEDGSVIDDGTLFNIGPNLYRWTCGGDESLPHLREQARRGGFHARILEMTKTLCTLSVQGPLSRNILAPLLFTQPTQPDFSALPWFGGCVARLHNRDGAPLYASRTGYTGELGYELFCHNQDAETLWDAVAKAGGENITPMGTEALNILRTEAGLAAMGGEFGGMTDAFEAGLGFAVNLDKGDFIGAQALRRIAGAPRRKLAGLKLEGNETAQRGDTVYCGRRPVGEVTTGVYSPALQQSIAMARIGVEHAQKDAPLEIGKMDGHAKRLPAVITGIPFIDPQRKKPRGLE